MRQFREKVREQFDAVYRFAPSVKKMLWLMVIASLLFWGVLWMQRNKPEPEEFYPAKDNHSTGYSELEIELLSWPVAQEGKYSYYIVADEEWYVYLVRMTKEQFSALQEVYDYTFGEGEAEAIKKTIRGMTKEISEELYEVSIEGFLVFTDTSADMAEYKEYVGAYYLDCTAYPYQGEIYFCVALMVVCLGLTFGWFLYYLKKRNLYKRCERNLQPMMIALAEAQLETAKICQPLPILLLKDYVVETEGSVLLLPLSDITKLVVSNLLGVGKQLTVWTAQGMRIVLCCAKSKAGEGALLELANQIKERNPVTEAIIPAETMCEPEEEAFAEIKCENE